MTSFFGVPPITVTAWMAGAVGLILLGLLLFAGVNRILLRMALRNIPRRRAQSVLIVFGLMLATLIITSSLAIGDTSSYSLQAIELRQMAGIAEAFTRPGPNNVQGAGVSDSDFFTAGQLAAVHAAVRTDSNIAAVSEAIVVPGSMVDVTTGQTSSENVAIFGVAPDFGAVWGALHSNSGGTLDVASLSNSDVFIGKQLADHLAARPGDSLQLYVDGHPLLATVRGVIDTEVNPSISNHGPIVNSVVVPLDEMRTLLNRPEGVNVVFVHNNGDTADEVSRRMAAAFTDQQSAVELKDLLDQAAVKTQLIKLRDDANFLDPDKGLADRLIVELGKPGVTDEFKALAQNRFVDRIMLQAVVQTVPPGQMQAAQNNLVQHVLALHVDTAAAADLKTLLQEPAVTAGMAGLGQPILMTELQQPGVSAQFKAIVFDTTVQAQFRQIVAAAAPGELARYDADAAALSLTVLQPYWTDAITFAEQGGLVSTGALLAVSFFSLCVGVLLIFLIFVMLAAERRAEMGMSRAVGLKRRHLTQMFLFEGMAYTLTATVIGVALGVVVGFLMTGVLSTIFANFYPGLSLIYHVEWTSLVIAACLGILLTFAVVSVSAYRVSRLNIVAAIRDLDESEQRDAGMWRMFLNVFATAWFGVRQLLRGHALVFLNRVTVGALGAIRAFWWALFRRGPLTILFGLALAYVGSNVQVELLYFAGVSLIVIGVGLSLRWALTLARLRRTVASRAGFTLAAIGLLIYWGQPFGRVEKLIHIDGRGTLEHIVQLDQMTGGPEVFALSALMVLLGAIWLVMYNSDLLIRGVMFFTGRVAGLAAITRTSMAYPMSTKFRTGMAVAMFGIVTFMVVFMSVFQDVLVQNFADTNALSGGWQIVAGTPDTNYDLTEATKLPADIASTVASNPATAADVKGTGWEDNSRGVALQQVHVDGSVTPFGNRVDYMGLHAVDAGFLSTTTYQVAPRAAGFGSDRAVWEAVRDNPGYVVVDASVLDPQNGRPATITGIKRSDASFQPFQVQLATSVDKTGQGPSWRVTVIGFMPQSNWTGLYMSTDTARQGSAFNTEHELRPTGYYFSLRSGVDVNKARLDLGRLLAPQQVEPVIVADQLQQQVGGFLSLLKLMTGFLALGLAVGIAGLGVISTRAVVERFQQIGMLRALGYRRSLVQRSFLMESSFIAIIGLVIGALVGVWQSYTFFVTDAAFGVVTFHVPVMEIALILVGSYLATLLTTYLPSRAAARVAPAEALRYE